MKKYFAVIFLLAAFGAAFYFRNDLTAWYFRLTQKISGSQTINFSKIVEDIKSEIAAPPPLKALKEIAGAATLTQSGVIGATNAQRALAGLGQLTENAKLDAAALAKARDMFAKQYFEHESPTGVGPAKLVAGVSYDFILVGENLALGNYDNDKALVQAWMDSPGHRANILNTKYREIGVAVLKGKYENRTTWIAVQEFGLPLSVCAKPASALKSQINADEQQLNSLSDQINQVRIAFDEIITRDAAYIKKVQLYNNLVKQYNGLLSETKNLVAQYNGQVSGFNSCVKSFSAAK